MAIGALKEKRDNETLDPEYLRGLNDSILALIEFLPYEKTYHRNIAEKAIDWASENYDERRLGVERADKNKYLNKNTHYERRTETSNRELLSRSRRFRVYQT